jgi:molybdate transport system substrate-binding protein
MSRPLITRAHASALLFGAAVLGSIRFPSSAQTNATLRIIAAVPVKAALDAIVPLFEKASGHDVGIEYGAGDIPTKIAAGEAFDVVILGTAAMDALVKGGFVLPDSQAMFGTAVFELAYRSSTSRPDISTPDALKAVLLNAKTISYSDPAAGGPSSVYFAGLIEQLGLRENVQRKAILTKPGQGAFPVGDGRADIGVAQSSEIASAPGVEGVPLAPSDPKAKSRMAAGISSKSTETDAARAFIRFMLAPDATAIRKSKGFAIEP